MYLPTGTPHAARAQDTASLHVTVGVNRLTWRSLLRQVVDEALEEQEYDAPLPAGYLDDPSVLRDAITERLRQLGGALSRTAADDVAAKQVTRFLTGRNPVLAGGLTDRLRLAAVDDTTVLRRRPGSVCVLAPAGDRLRVLLGDRAVLVPGRLLEPLQEIRDRDTVRPADLAHWLDPQSRLVLCRRLVREGLLRVDG